MTTGGTARYSSAYKAGNAGRSMPRGLADLADSDPKIDHAYDAGARNVPFEQFQREHGLVEPPKPPSRPAVPRRSSSRRAGRRASSGSRRSAPSLTAPLAPVLGKPEGAGETVSGILLGMVVYALVLSWIDYGVQGPKLWFKAKFLNIPAGGQAPPTVTQALQRAGQAPVPMVRA